MIHEEKWQNNSEGEEYHCYNVAGANCWEPFMPIETFDVDRCHHCKFQVAFQKESHQAIPVKEVCDPIAYSSQNSEFLSKQEEYRLSDYQNDEKLGCVKKHAYSWDKKSRLVARFLESHIVIVLFWQVKVLLCQLCCVDCF